MILRIVLYGGFNHLKNKIIFIFRLLFHIENYLNDLADLHGILGLHCRHLEGGGAGADQVGRVLVNMVIACTENTISVFTFRIKYFKTETEATKQNLDRKHRLTQDETPIFPAFVFSIGAVFGIYILIIKFSVRRLSVSFVYKS